MVKNCIVSIKLFLENSSLLSVFNFHLLSIFGLLTVLNKKLITRWVSKNSLYYSSNITTTIIPLSNTKFTIAVIKALSSLFRDIYAVLLLFNCSAGVSIHFFPNCQPYWFGNFGIKEVIDLRRWLWVAK